MKVTSTCGHKLASDGHYHPIYNTGKKGNETKILCCKCANHDFIPPETVGGSEDTTQGVRTPQASNQVARQAISEGVTGLHPGEVNELHTRQLIRETHRNFLQIGKLLRESRENAYWSTAGKWESFSDYIESLGISKSAGYSMIACWEFQSVGKLTEDEILEIGIAKMGLLTSADKCGKLNTETIELAKVAPVRDLKEHLGHKVVENDKEVSIICPSCGKAILGAKWARKGTIT